MRACVRGVGGGKNEVKKKRPSENYISNLTSFLKFLKFFFKQYPCSDNVVFFSIKLNKALQAVSEIFFYFRKRMSGYSTKSIKKNNEKNEELSHFVFLS